ncbi:MAG TPA: DUF1189 family protein [Patescibacteria group bacterium]
MEEQFIQQAGERNGNNRIFKRFFEIFKPGFLAENLDTIDSGKTWKFWFLSNTLVAIVLTIIIGYTINKGIDETAKEFLLKYPNAKIFVSGGKLSTEGIDEPIFEKSDDGSVFVLDTKNQKYDETVLSDYKKGVFISSDKIYNKKSSIETQQYDISKINRNFSFTQKDLQSKVWILKVFFIGVGIFFGWIYLNGLRLISAFWWAFWFWLLAVIMKIEGVGYKNIYFAVLNFYIIPLVISLVLTLFGLNVAFLTTIIFSILFVVNFLFMKKNQKQKEVVIKE